MSAKRLGTVGCIGLSLAAACASSNGGPAGALEPRFLAVHNTLAAMGMAQTGPIHQGLLAEGREARVPLDLPAGCTTAVAIGGDAMRDVDLSLLDAQGRSVAHDTTAEPEATLRVCLDAPGAYTLVVRAASGAGSWVAATWQGAIAAPPSPSASVASASRQPVGTCESPIPLAPGTVSGTTAHGEDQYTGSCERSDAREIVYELDVAQRERVVLDVEARFDSVLYIRKDTCGDPDAEVECNDDAPNGGRNRSRIERVLDPGKYFVFVDGYNQETGNYKLTLTTSEVLSLGQVCQKAQLLAVGAPAAGTTEGRADDASASCGGGAAGNDVPWRFDVPARSRVRVTEHADGMSPVVHLRHVCTEEDSEIACGEAGLGIHDAAVGRTLEAGSYAAFADARDHDAAGPYTMQLETAAPSGDGTSGDSCGDAAVLQPGRVQGDTFAARDDLAGSCGGAGAPDVVYRLDVPERSRLVAALDQAESQQLLVVWRHCGDRSSEVACGRFVDAVVAPGSYWVAVDGASPDEYGRFSINWSLQDLTAQATACAAAPVLQPGRTVSASTAGAGDRFASSCAGGNSLITGPDRVFRFSLSSAAKVRVSLVAASFEAALSLRKACGDAPGAELDCRDDSDIARRTTLQRALEPGSYWVVVDGQSPNDQGAFTLDFGVVGGK
ncbi:MAG TPA: hypothetical protein VF765_04365 [Polyangiaceae bacterium]